MIRFEVVIREGEWAVELVIDSRVAMMSSQIFESKEEAIGLARKLNHELETEIPIMKGDKRVHV